MDAVHEIIDMEEEYYNLPDRIQAELIDGVLIYNQAAPLLLITFPYSADTISGISHRHNP